MKFKDRLMQLIKENHGSRKNTARLLGISEGYLSQLTSGTRNPSRELEEKFILALQKKATLPEDLTPPERSNVRPAGSESGLRRVPVVSMAQCGRVLHDYQDLCNQIDELIETDSKDPNAFAVRLVGDSMESWASAGDTVILNPNTRPQNGQAALVRLKSGETLFKWFFQTGEHGEKIWLSSENKAAYPTLVFHVEEIEWAYSMQRLIRQNQTRRMQDFVTPKPNATDGDGLPRN